MTGRAGKRRHKRAVLISAVVAMLVLAAGMAGGSDAQSPFDTYYRSPDPLVLDDVGPRIASSASPAAVRLSRSGSFAYAVGPFREAVTGAVSFHTVRAVASAKPKRRKLTLGRKTYRAAAGKPGRVKIKLSRKNRKVLRRYGTLRIRARVLATDASDNDSYKSLYFTLKRPR